MTTACELVRFVRDAMYMQSTTALKASMVEFSNSVGAQLGVQYPYTVTAPLATSLAGTQFIRLFLDQVRGPALFACVPSGNRVALSPSPCHPCEG